MNEFDPAVLPSFSTDLVQQLDEIVPSGIPDINQSEREIWMNVGQRRLVEQLKERLAVSEQSELRAGKDSVSV